MTLIQTLTNIYRNHEYWHTNKLSQEESDKYHERLLLNGNILTYILKDELIGYLEYWNITYEQFGRLVCGKPIATDMENIVDGNISLINNMWIHPDYKHGDAFDMLSAMFLTKNNKSDFYVAFRRVKRNQPIQVYTRSEIMKHFKRS